MTKAKKQTPVHRTPNPPGKPARTRAKRNASARALGDRIQQLVKESAGGSVSAFARALGVQTSQVSNWQAGKNEPGAAHLRRMAQRTTVSLDWLILGIGGDQPRYTTETRPAATFIDEFAAYIARRAAPLVGEALRMPVDADALQVDAARILDDVIENETRACVASREFERKATHLAAAITGTMVEIMELGAEHARYLPDAEQRAIGKAIGSRLLANSRARDAFRVGDLRRSAIQFPHPATVELPIFKSAVRRGDGMKMFLGQSESLIPYLEGLDRGSESLAIPHLQGVIETLKRSKAVTTRPAKVATRRSRKARSGARKSAP